MQIKKFRLVGYSGTYNQVIIGGSKIKIDLEIDNYDGSEILIDISNYSKIKFINVNTSIFSKIINVDFLGESGLDCGKNDLKTRVNLKVGDIIYYSNTIGDYIYNQNFLLETSNFYIEEDHHLGVYNKFEVDYKQKSEKISECMKYPNDIIFINRNKKNLDNFIFLGLDFNEILKKYLTNLKKGIKSIIYIDIFSHEMSDHMLFNLKQILKIFKFTTYYFYNIDYCYLKDFYFDKKYYLYNYHFKPFLKNKVLYLGDENFIFNTKKGEDFIEEKFYFGGESIDFFYYKNYNKNKKIKKGINNIGIIGCSIALGTSGKNEDFRFSKLLQDKKNNVLTYAIGNHNIAEIFIQYNKFIKKRGFNITIYVYGNDHIYFSKKIGKNRYTTPTIIDKGIEYDIKSNLLSYKEYLYNRFKMYVNELYKKNLEEGSRFIVIISPPSINHIRYKEISEIDLVIYNILLSSNIEVYNLYDIGVQNCNYYINNDFHLNKEGHIFYANFIKNILNND